MQGPTHEQELVSLAAGYDVVVVQDVWFGVDRYVIQDLLIAAGRTMPTWISCHAGYRVVWERDTMPPWGYHAGGGTMQTGIHRQLNCCGEWESLLRGLFAAREGRS